jgi:mannitol/fructose-specific phosphotransferase system IIA component (Ntr-type)
MRITDLLDKRSVSLTAAPKGKSEALDMAVDLMIKSEKISDREAYRKQVYLRLIRNAQREQEMMQSSPVSVIIIKKIIVAE